MNSLPPTDQLELAVAYVLDDVSEEDRLRLQSLLSSADASFSHSVQLVMDTLSELSDSLDRATPPPFLKERIMARIHEQAEPFEHFDGFVPPAPLLTRVLNYLPGYGSAPARNAARLSRSALRQRPTRRKTIGIAFLFVAACFATGYGFEQVQHVVKKAEDARDQVLDRVRHTKAFAEKFAEIESTRIAELAAAEAPATSNLGHTPASLRMSEPDELSIRGISPVRQAPRLSLPNTSGNATPIAEPKSQSQSATIDLSTFEGALFFMSDHSGQHFALRPVNDISAGKATIYWNPARREALLAIQDLKATTENQRYSLRYVMDDGTTEEIYHFTEPVDGGQHQLTLEHGPNHHVIGAQLYLESAMPSGQLSRETILSATARLQNK